MRLFLILIMAHLAFELSACSNQDMESEDPIRTIQNRQLLLDGNRQRLVKADESPLNLPIPRDRKSRDGLLNDSFDVDQTTGKIDFKAEVVYFKFNQSTLTEAGKQQLESLANFMIEHSDLTLNIEGHCDERGSEEYNLALGKRRSESVKRYLISLKVGKERLGTLSFGKVRPAVIGESEESWAKNRRAEFTFSSVNGNLAH